MQISILDLLYASPQHQKILDEALKESLVLDNIGVVEFQAMVGNLSTLQYITFSTQDIPKDIPNHHILGFT